VRVPLSDKYILARKDALVHSAKDIAPAKHLGITHEALTS